MLGQLFSHQGRCRHFDHHPQFRALAQAQFNAQGVQAAADMQQLVDLGDHWQQDAATLHRADLQQGAQLPVKDLRVQLRQADAAQAQYRIGFGGQRQIIELFVAAHINGANDHRLVAHRIDDTLVGGNLLLFIGRSGAFDKQKLGAQQPHAIRAMGVGAGGFVAGGHIGGNLDLLPVAGHCRFMGMQLLPGKALLAGENALLNLFDAAGGGCQLQARVVGVENHLLSGRQRQQLATEGYQARQAFTPGQNGDMGRGPACGHAQAGNVLRAEHQQIGRRQFVCGNNGPRG